MEGWKVAPLKSSFALAAVLGFVITVIYTDRIGEDWAFALGFVFALMFVASMISMKKAPIEAQIEMSPDLMSVEKGRPKKKAGKKKK
ncbi:hypothetical protein KY359_02725 [Candidatus Woesearchaeota archaeon]|nr:hypothetical protein [Candidatus Woesearchaeota archaeon]